MSDDNILLTIEGDASSGDEALASIDEILAQFQATAESTAETIAMMGAQMDEVLGSLADTIAGTDAAFAGLDGSAATAAGAMDGLATSAGAASASLDTAAASAGATADAEAAAGDAAELNTGKFKMMGLAALVATGFFVKMGADGEDALTRVQALTGASTAQMDQYSAAISDMSGKVGATVSNLSGGLYDIVSVGFTGKDALNTLNVAAEAAAAGGVDLHTVTSGLTSIMKGFGVQGKDASSVMDTLLLGVRDGKASFQDYSNAIGLVAVTAHGAGFSLKESTAALSTLTAVFPSARQAGMDLRHLLTSVGVNAANVADQAKKMGLHFDLTKFQSMDLQHRLEYLQTVTKGNQAEMLKLTGGSAGYAAAQVLLSGKSADFTRNLKDQKNATGATQAAFDTWSKSVGAHAGDTAGSLSSLAKAFVVMTGPLITGGLDALSSVFSGLASFIEQHGTAAKIILGALAIVIGGILVPVLGSLAVAAWAALAPILVAAAPFIAVGLAVGALALGIKALWDHFAPFRAAVASAQHTLAQFGGEIQQRLGPALHNIQTIIGAVLKPIQAMWNQTWPAMSALLRSVWGIISGVVQVAFSIVKGVIFVILDALSGNWSKAWSDMKDMFTGIWQGIQRALMGVLTFIGGLILKFVGGILGLLSKIPGPIGDMAKGALAAVNHMQAGMNAAMNSMNTNATTETSKMSTAVQMHTAQMQMAAVKHADIMRRKIIDAIAHTHDAAKKHALEMQLQVVTAFERTHLEAAKHAEHLASEAAASMKGMGEKMTQHATTMHDDVLHLIGTMVDKTLEHVARMHDKTLSSIGSMATGAVNALSGLPGAFGAIGANLASSLANAITAGTGQVKGSLAHLAHGALGAIKGQFGISSPSTVFAEIGRNLSLGLIGGMRGVDVTGAALQHFSGVLNAGARLTSGAYGGAGAGLGVPSSAYGAGLGGGGPIASLLAQIAQNTGRAPQLGAGVVPANTGTVVQQFPGAQFNGVHDVNALYALLNQLAGLSVENGLRGTQLGIGL